MGAEENTMHGERHEYEPTAEQVVDAIETRVRKTIGPTFGSHGPPGTPPSERIEGRISQSDFNDLVALARIGAQRTQ